MRHYWTGTCEEQRIAPGPHGYGYLRKGRDAKLCRQCWRDSLGEEPGDRYQVARIVGWPITGSRSGGWNPRPAKTTWYVQDRCYNFRPVGEFSSRTFTRGAEAAALRLCGRMNREERLWEGLPARVAESAVA